MKQIDERDTIFSRMTLKKDHPFYEDYYSRYPDKKSIDDELRKKPAMGDTNSRYYNSLVSPMVQSAFVLLSQLKELSDIAIKAGNPSKGDPKDFTLRIKGLAKHYGAKTIGITQSHNNYYYSNKGRKDYGKPIHDKLTYSIIFGVEMDSNLINSAPKISQSIAVTKGYIDAAIIGLVLTYFIKQLGYNAINHMDGNYLLVLPIAGKYAGIGDIGRNSLLVTPELGCRIRLGAVTTDIPLCIDSSSKFKITDFCIACGRCARYCPARAIPENLPKLTDNTRRWQIKQEKCYARWQTFGTDCGICISVCPFSLPLTPETINKYCNDPDTAGQILKQIPLRLRSGNIPECFK